MIAFAANHCSVGLAVLLFSSVGTFGIDSDWNRLSPLPDREGFAGPFAGVSHGALLVAGGANFPGKKPWEGGKKVWSDAVYVLDRPNGEWKVAGKLPRPLGYGVSVTHRDGVICVGGSDADKHFADAFRLEWNEGKLKCTSLPALPKPVANACGALVGDVLYLAGGQEKPDSTSTFKAVWSIDLAAKEPKWKPVEAWPGSGRMLAMAAGFDGQFWLVGGVDLVEKDGKAERRYLKDAYRYDPKSGWKRIADLPTPLAAATSPAPFDKSGVHILGGDDGLQAGVAPDRHRGFRKTILRYMASHDRWAEAGEFPAASVTVPCVRWGETWIVSSGEIRPGIRTPAVWQWRPGHQE